MPSQIKPVLFTLAVEIGFAVIWAIINPATIASHWWVGAVISVGLLIIAWVIPTKTGGVYAISLDGAYRYLARKSRWSAKYDSQDPYFLVRVGNELRDAILNKDIVARGRPFNILRGGIKNPALYAQLQIEPEDLRSGDFNPWWALNESFESARQPSTIYINENEGWHDVIINYNTLVKKWKKRTTMDKLNDRFDRLLSAMAPKAISKKKPLDGQASDAERGACSSDIQTRPDTSEDASR